MKTKSQAISNEIDQLADDAQALINATADVAGEKVGQARTRLVAALERGKEIYDQLRESELEAARIVDAAAHEHLYKTLAIGTAAGVLVGYLLSRGCSCRRD